jgi:hypothetical protein
LEAIENNRQEATIIWTERGCLALNHLSEYHEAIYGLFGPLKKQTPSMATTISHVKENFSIELSSLHADIDRVIINREKNELLSTEEAAKSFMKEGYLFRKRQKGIGTPWKRVFVSLGMQAQI